MTLSPFSQVASWIRSLQTRIWSGTASTAVSRFSNLIDPCCLGDLDLLIPSTCMCCAVTHPVNVVPLGVCVLLAVLPAVCNTQCRLVANMIGHSQGRRARHHELGGIGVLGSSIRGARTRLPTSSSCVRVLSCFHSDICRNTSTLAFHFRLSGLFHVSLCFRRKARLS